MILFWFALIAVGFLFFLGLSLIVAMQARRRGYPLFPWLIAGMLGNSIFFLVVLGVLPDFARLARRKRYLQQIEEKLALQAREPAVDSIVHPVGRDAERSLGDLPTYLPQRSLGDEQTRP